MGLGESLERCGLVVSHLARPKSAFDDNDTQRPWARVSSQLNPRVASLVRRQFFKSPDELYTRPRSRLHRRLPFHKRLSRSRSP
jgi:hypothetical protein